MVHVSIKTFFVIERVTGVTHGPLIFIQKKYLFVLNFFIPNAGLGLSKQSLNPISLKCYICINE